MKCPNCGCRSKINISEGKGYSQDIRECGACGTVWSFVESQIKIIQEGKQVLMECSQMCGED